jgi:hypothetical protein
MKHFFTLAYILYTFSCYGQRWQVEGLAGISGYSGDLSDYEGWDFHSLRPALNANIKYSFTDYISLRAGLAYGQIAGSDRFSRDSARKHRNLSFKTMIAEANICMEVNLLSPELFTYYPYVFAGIGVFNFNPYAYDQEGEKVFLQPLQTEGQGLTGLTNQEKYPLTQFCIPLGAGIKYDLHERFSLGIEFGFRKLFTDYLDDVSTTYPDPHLLLAEAGSKSVEMAYRSNEGNTHYTPYPPAGSKRGNPKQKDWYYFGGFKITWNL